MIIAFKECEEGVKKVKCTEFTTEALIELVDLKSSPSLELGLWLEPFANKGEAKKEDLKITCGVISVLVLGSLLAKVDNVTSLVKTKTAVVLWHQTKDEQEVKTCELLKALCEKGPFELKAKFTAEAPEELAAEEAEAEHHIRKRTRNPLLAYALK